MGQKWAEPVKKPILGVGRFAGVEPGIFQGIFYRLGAAWMRRGWQLGLAARCEYGARVKHSSSTSGARGLRVGDSAES
jgi:hypothetical protein